MRNETPTNKDGRRRRLSDAELTPEQRAAVEAHRADRQTSQYQDELARDIEAYRQEYPPVGDPELVEALAGLRLERERQGLSLTDMAERTGIDRATISKLETGKIANPTVGTLDQPAKAAAIYGANRLPDHATWLDGGSHGPSRPSQSLTLRASDGERKCGYVPLLGPRSIPGEGIGIVSIREPVFRQTMY